MKNASVIKLYYAGLLALSLVFAAYTIHVGSMNVMFGQQMSKLEKDAAALTEQKIELQQQIAEQTSFAQIAQKAQQEGYQSQTNIVEVAPSQSVALR
jgi:cell division protein FtsL